MRSHVYTSFFLKIGDKRYMYSLL